MNHEVLQLTRLLPPVPSIEGSQLHDRQRWLSFSMRYVGQRERELGRAVGEALRFEGPGFLTDRDFELQFRLTIYGTTHPGPGSRIRPADLFTLSSTVHPLR